MAKASGAPAGWIGLHLVSTEYTVEPGGSLTLAPIVANNGSADDAYNLSVVGVPGDWVSTPSPFVVVPAGEQREASLTIQPPRHFASKAGRRAITIRAQSQSAAPGQAATADCVLTVGVFCEFGARLYPEGQAAGQPFRVTVQNRGNIQDVFALTCQSLSHELDFGRPQPQTLPLAPGQESTAQFRAWPRQRPYLGGERSYPLLLQVQSLTRQRKNLRGEVTSRALLPSWLLLGLLLFLMACACMVLALILTQGI